MRMLLKVCLLASVVIFPVTVYSQVETQPVQPPWYFYWPTENPDNFEYSELGNSSFGGGNTFERRSNIEVNKRAETPESPSAPSAPSVETSIGEDLDTPDSSFDTNPPSSSSIYKWVDDKGVVHVTNEPGTIPEQYRDQITN